jgi:FMN-dependent NADH-azoreductase
MNILLVTSSPRGEASYSTRLARNLAARLLRDNPSATLTERDLVRDPLPFIGEGFVAATHTPAKNRSVEDRRALELSDTLVDELRLADIIVIGSGMINFGVPAPLKAWIDHVTRSGLTFSYGSSGPEGLLQGKKTYLALASGGVYSDGPAAAMDFQRPYLLAVLGFVGLTDVEVILAEGTKMSPNAGELAFAAASEQIARLASPRPSPLTTPVYAGGSGG